MPVASSAAATASSAYARAAAMSSSAASSNSSGFHAEAHRFSAAKLSVTLSASSPVSASTSVAWQPVRMTLPSLRSTRVNDASSPCRVKTLSAAKPNTVAVATMGMST